MVYVLSIVLIFGLIGNFCNILIFISIKQFRHYPGAFYIIAESTIDSAVLLLGVMVRIIIEASGYDATNSSLIWCKLRTPMNQWCSLMTLSIVNFMTIDQYFSTSCNPSLRQLSTIKLAKYLIGIAAIVWVVYNVPFAIFYDIIAVVGCLLNNVTFARFYTIFHLLILFGILPILIACLFSILAYRNVRRIHRQQLTRTRRRLDRQLTAMILARVTVFILFLIPFIVQRFYATNVPINPNNTLRTAIEQLVGAINISLTYVNVSVCSVSILSSFVL
jgi:hypothetical protein